MLIINRIHVRFTGLLSKIVFDRAFIKIKLRPWLTLITLVKIVALKVVYELFALCVLMDNLDRKGNNMKKRRGRKFGETGVLFFYQSPQSY